MIPDDVRSKRLLTESNPIHNATASLSDPNMVILVKVWETFIEPQKEVGTCPICLNNILTNFRQMHETLIELEQDYQKLKLI
jgi:hypothetical protein